MSDFGLCYECTDQRHAACLGVPCNCPCPGPPPARHAPETEDPRKVVLWLIAEDMYRDTLAMDGKPLTGRVVGGAFGEVRAAVMHLAVQLAGIHSELRDVERWIGKPPPGEVQR